MAQGEISSVNSEKISHRFTRALSSAFFEWLLLFMLFIDAIVSYLITKFAHKCKLQTPCLLCSRLDHIFGKEKLKFYWDLVCDNHKFEISSLVYCNAHNKLADVHGMCETCLFSFATINKSNAETYRLLVAKLGEDFESGLEEDLSLENHKLGGLTVRHCSCCDESWMQKGFVKKLMQTRSTVSQATQFDLPLPFSSELSQDDQNSSGNASILVQATHQRKKCADPLSHVTYTELKITSDSESEVATDVGSEEDALIIQSHHQQRDFVDQHVQPESQTFTLLDDLDSEKFMDPASAPKPSKFTPQSESDIIEPLGTISMESTNFSGHDLEELNWEQASSKIEPSASSELISIDYVPLLKGAEASIVVSTEMNLNSLDKVPSLSNAGAIPIQGSEGSELIFLNFLSSSSLGNETPVEVSKEIKHISMDDSKIEPSASSELISLDDVPLLSKGVEASINVPTERNLNSVDKVPLLSNAGEIPIEESEGSKIISLDCLSSLSLGNETPVEISKEIKHISIDDVSPSDVVASSVEESKESSVMGSLEDEKISMTKCEEICKSTGQPLPILESLVEENRVANSNSIEATNSLDLTDAYKLAVGSKGRQFSGLLVEQWIGKDSSRLSEDLRVLLSQLSARGFEQSTNDASPRVTVSPRISMHSDDLKASDSSTFNGIQILQKRISLERNESGLSIDGSIVSEIEGESVVDRLKRQVEHDRKLLSTLYKELEEERNASAVAANQAMAMITRLQEEKAMLQMEALQNLRMMEEQAEYDMEALQNTNNLLEEKEKEIQDLEAELEFYRMKFPNEFMLDGTVNSASDLQATQGTVVHSKANGIEEKASIQTKPVSEKPNICCTVEEPDQSFEDTIKNPLTGYEKGYHEELIP